MSKYKAAFQLLFAAYPRWDVPPETIATWEILMGDIDADTALIAAGQLASESAYPPSLAEWKQRARSLSGDGPGNRLTAAEAWDELTRNRRKVVGRLSPTSVAWSSEAVQRAAHAVRYTDTDWLSDQIPTIRAQFERYYLALAAKTDAIDAANDARALLERPGVRKMLTCDFVGEVSRAMKQAPFIEQGPL